MTDGAGIEKRVGDNYPYEEHKSSRYYLTIIIVLLLLLDQVFQACAMMKDKYEYRNKRYF